MDPRHHQDSCWIKVEETALKTKLFPVVLACFRFIACVLVYLPAEIVAAQPELQRVRPPSIVELVF